MSIRVLFLGHGAERTGPPVLLLRFARWLRSHASIETQFVLLEGGPLLDEFRSLGPTWVVGDRGRVAPTPPDLIYVNTAGSVHALRSLPAFPAPVITQIHELSAGLEHFLAPPDLALLLEVTDRYLTVSDAVTAYVVDHLGVPSGKVACHPGFVDRLPPAQGPVAEGGPPAGALVVGACGTTGWRKGPDLFLATAAELRRARPDLDCHFVWVGGPSGEGDGLDRVLAGARAAHLTDRVHLVGPVEDPVPWFRRFDVFALTSREDAFPLVGLEAAAVGTPLVCFDNGGLPELVHAAGCGTVVPYPDLQGLSDAVARLLDDPAQRAEMGARGAAHVAARHTTEVSAPGLLAEITALVPS